MFVCEIIMIFHSWYTACIYISIKPNIKTGPFHTEARSRFHPSLTPDAPSDHRQPSSPSPGQVSTEIISELPFKVILPRIISHHRRFSANTASHIFSATSALSGFLFRSDTFPIFHTHELFSLFYAFKKLWNRCESAYDSKAWSPIAHQYSFWSIIMETVHTELYLPLCSFYVIIMNLF